MQFITPWNEDSEANSNPCRALYIQIHANNLRKIMNTNILPPVIDNMCGKTAHHDWLTIFSNLAGNEAIPQKT